MTRDIIMDTTVSFIKANERNLELAFEVEKALPEARKELIEEFFKCVEKQLKENVETIEEWEIRATGEGLWIRKKHWTQLKVGNYSEDWWGIRLLPKIPFWPHSSISVANIEEISDDVKEQIRNEFSNYIGEYQADGPYIWQYLKDAKGFASLDFLKKMVNDKEREEITKDMADKLAKLAKAVDKAFNNV